MTTTNSKRRTALEIAVCAALGACFYLVVTCHPPTPKPPLAKLPEDAVVARPATADELPPQVITKERLVTVYKPVDREVIRTVSAAPGELFGRVIVDAEMYIGQDPADANKVAFGVRGTARCVLKTADGGEVNLFEPAPFDRKESTVLQLPPAKIINTYMPDPRGYQFEGSLYATTRPAVGLDVAVLKVSARNVAQGPLLGVEQAASGLTYKAGWRWSIRAGR